MIVNIVVLPVVTINYCKEEGISKEIGPKTGNLSAKEGERAYGLVTISNLFLAMELLKMEVMLAFHEISAEKGLITL